jgi:uncharacterized protein
MTISTIEREILIIKLVDELSWKKTAFAINCIQRLLPYYAKFTKDTKFGDVQVLRNAVNDIKISLLMQEQQNFSLQAADCEKQLPDTEQFSSEYTTAALSVATACVVLLESLDDANVKIHSEVGQLALDAFESLSLSKFAGEVVSKDFERELEESPLVQSELQNQIDDLRILFSRELNPAQFLRQNGVTSL